MKRFGIAALLLLLLPTGLPAQSVHYESELGFLEQAPDSGVVRRRQVRHLHSLGSLFRPGLCGPALKGRRVLRRVVLEPHAGQEWTRRGHFTWPTTATKFKYQDFAAQLQGGAVRPRSMGRPLPKSGARYVVLTSKHHEGFCLGRAPASLELEQRGPRARTAIWPAIWRAPWRQRAEDGFLLFALRVVQPALSQRPSTLRSEHMFPQMKDLVTAIIRRSSGPMASGTTPARSGRSTDFLAWLFNESPVRDEIVIDDRWGKETSSKHGGFYTSEYQTFVPGGVQLGPAHKWEEDQGIGKSFGYNRVETADDYKSANALIELLVNAVAKGGNFLLISVRRPTGESP